MPTSRATRVTSDVKTESCSIIVLTSLAERRNSPLSARPSTSRSIDWLKVTLGDGTDGTRDLDGRSHEVVDQCVDGIDLDRPIARWPRAATCAA